MMTLRMIGLRALYHGGCGGRRPVCSLYTFKILIVHLFIVERVFLK